MTTWRVPADAAFIVIDPDGVRACCRVVTDEADTVTIEYRDAGRPSPRRVQVRKDARRAVFTAVGPDAPR